MGNCCKFIKRSRYRNDEKSVDPVGYKKTSNYNIEGSGGDSYITAGNNFPRQSNVFLNQNQGNTNALAYQSDTSLNNLNGASKSKTQLKSSQFNNASQPQQQLQYQQANIIIGNGIGIQGGSLKQKNFNNHNNSIVMQPGLVNGYENRSEDVNASIPHIADFYPEGNFYPENIFFYPGD